MTPSRASRLFAERALLPGGWANDVAVDIDDAGRIAIVEPGAARAGRDVVAGPVLPAMPNLHSHAFQRAMAGLAEAAGAGEDSFWTWRETMYRIVGRLTPESVEAIATRLYVDLLKAGYGSVAEFHYLHHGPGGVSYADPAEMSERILAAAAASGIRLTLLPVFYAHAGFGGQPPGDGQRRFVHDVEDFLALFERLRPRCAAAGAGLGLAFHSLRAATLDEMRAILDAVPAPGPIHIHVAEQAREVEDCLAFCGRRPIARLFDTMPVDHAWCLIHATHADRGEIGLIATAGAIAGLCPTTEANLGDGLFPAAAFQAAGGCFGIGSDSHVSLSVVEELRWLEYGQRLRDERRSRLAGGPGRSTGRTLYDSALIGGSRALGIGPCGLEPGAPADLIVLDGQKAFIALARGDQILDRWLFAEGSGAVRDVMVAGAWAIREGRHARDEEIDRAFLDAIETLASN